jgi:predicted secreted hydrolase
MDHEFFSEVDDRDTAGWDWMCIQLNTDEELMLYRLRQSDGGNSPYSSGTFTDRNGHATFLSQKEFSLRPGRTWKSSATGGEYPVEWDIEVPSKNLKLYLTPALDAQELVNRITRDYWEGSVRFSGTEGSAKIAGQGYLEMTGYTLRKNEKGFGGKAER